MQNLCNQPLPHLVGKPFNLHTNAAQRGTHGCNTKTLGKLKRTVPLLVVRKTAFNVKKLPKT